MRQVLMLSVLMTLGLALLAPDSLAVSVAAKGAVAGTVVDSGGQPVPGAKVTITDGNGFKATTRSSKRGKYAFKGLRPGKYVVAAAKKGVGKDRKRAAVKPKKTTRVRLKL